MSIDLLEQLGAYRHTLETAIDKAETESHWPDPVLHTDPGLITLGGSDDLADGGEDSWFARRWPVILAGAAAAAIFIVIWLFTGGDDSAQDRIYTDDSERQHDPTVNEPIQTTTTAVAIASSDKETAVADSPDPSTENGSWKWELIDGDQHPPFGAFDSHIAEAGPPLHPLERAVSNGSSFMAPVDFDGASSSLWRSTDGVSWNFDNNRDAPLGFLTAVDKTYVAAPPDSCNECRWAYESNDGLEWNTFAPAMFSPELSLGPITVWHVATMETVRQLDPPTMKALYGPNSVIMEFDDAIVMYGHDTRSGYGTSVGVAALELATGSTEWQPFDLPTPFADSFTNSYVTEGFWSVIWRCQFAARDSIGMAFAPAENTHALWTTHDGKTWSQVELPQDIPDEWDRPCITALGDGWMISPSRLTPTSLDAVLFSTNGVNWTPLPTLPEFNGLAVGAGNTIFFIEDAPTPNVLVGTYNP